MADVRFKRIGLKPLRAIYDADDAPTTYWRVVVVGSADGEPFAAFRMTPEPGREVRDMLDELRSRGVEALYSKGELESETDPSVDEFPF